MKMLIESSNSRCWSEIGVFGTADCPELSAFGHCRRCPVYAAAGRDLLNRPIPDGWLEERTAVMVREKEVECSDPLSVMVFRVAGEILALETQYFQQVAEMVVVRRLPLRSNRIFRGIVHIHGELHLCVSLSGLLDLTLEERGEANRNVFPRLMIIKKDGARFVFPVDEIRGVVRIARGELQDLPVTVAKGPRRLTKGLFHLDGVHVGLLSEDDLFLSLSRSLMP
ncbi:MAG: chemotaxis protein CheW [Syntrophus sp. (in: bacteria)]|nr:chemotaxis protein CheW [Syntrophus sp. (in: bacteria)]